MKKLLGFTIVCMMCSCSAQYKLVSIPSKYNANEKGYKKFEAIGEAKEVNLVDGQEVIVYAVKRIK